MADNKLIPLIKALGKPSAADITAAVDDWLDDHPEATTTVEDGSITKEKLDSNLQGTVDDVADLKSAIAQDIIPGLNTSDFDEAPTITWTSGKYVNSSTNAITNGSEVLYISNYVPIPTGVYKIAAENINRLSVAWTIAFYDSAKQFISGVQKASTAAVDVPLYCEDVPSNAKYLILTHYETGTYTVTNVGITFSLFERLVSIESDITAIKTAVDADATFENVLNGASTFQDNKNINDNGVVETNNNFVLIDGYYAIKPNTQYKLYRGEPALYSNSTHRWTWWDSNKAFISGTYSASMVTSPANAAYLRLAIYISSTGSATHANFDPANVIVTEDSKPCFDKDFTSLVSRPTFSGKKWVGIGDSMTEENFRANWHYYDYIKAETALTFVNMGVSGSGYKAEGSGDKAFYKRVPNMATDADVITIFGGVNDVVLSNATIGTASDTTTDTICGCVNETIDAIEELYPAHMPIGIISPLPCYCTDTSVNLHPYQNPDDDTCRMAQFVEQLALICQHRGIPFLDLFHGSNLRPWHEECNAKYFSCDSAPTGDGLHPNGHGHRLFYREILDFINRIVS